MVLGVTQIGGLDGPLRGLPDGGGGHPPRAVPGDPEADSAAEIARSSPRMNCVAAEYEVYTGAAEAVCFRHAREAVFRPRPVSLAPEGGGIGRLWPGNRGEKHLQNPQDKR
jgi:hypothetical protein